MIITEPYITEDGRELVRTYSDARLRICRNDGAIYDDAIDPPNSGRTYTETQIPIQGGDIVKYSTLSIKRELAQLGKWDAAKSLMESQGVWDDYILANYLAENDPVFAAARGAFIAAGILTQNELDEMLPKCIWVAD